MHPRMGRKIVFHFCLVVPVLHISTKWRITMCETQTKATWSALVACGRASFDGSQETAKFIDHSKFNHTFDNGETPLEWVQFRKKPRRNLDELFAGTCDGMTYKEIQEVFPEEFSRRLLVWSVLRARRTSSKNRKRPREMGIGVRVGDFFRGCVEKNQHGQYAILEFQYDVLESVLIIAPVFVYCTRAVDFNERSIRHTGISVRRTGIGPYYMPLYFILYQSCRFQRKVSTPYWSFSMLSVWRTGIGPYYMPLYFILYQSCRFLQSPSMLSVWRTGISPYYCPCILVCTSSVHSYTTCDMFLRNQSDMPLIPVCVLELLVFCWFLYQFCTFLQNVICFWYVFESVRI